MFINPHSTHQSFTFGQSTANKENSQDLNFSLPFVFPFAQSASSDSTFAETFTFDVQSIQPQNTIALRENFGVLGRIQKAEQAPKLLGFPLDDEGYLTATFNNAAGIPEDFKIHSQTIIDINNYPSTTTFEYLGLTIPAYDRRIQISTAEDLVNYFQTTYARLQEIMGDSLQTETGFFTQEQLDSMPHEFVTRDGSFGGEIKKVYNKEQASNANFELRYYSNGRKYYNNPQSFAGILGLEPKAHSLIPDSYDLKNPHLSFEQYFNENGHLSQGGLLAFAMWQGSMVANQQPDFYTQSYYDIQEGKMSMEEYIKQYAEGEFVEKSQQSIHQEMAKRQIAFATWLKDQGFREEDLNKMKAKDFENLAKNFRDLDYAYSRLQEEEKYAESQRIFFDPEAFLLQLFASHEALLDPKLLDVPDSLFEQIEQKRMLEDERYQPKQKEKQTLTQKVRGAGAALAKVEQFLKSA